MRSCPGRFVDPMGEQQNVPQLPPMPGSGFPMPQHPMPPPYNPTTTLPQFGWQLNIWLKQQLSANCSSCNYCNNINLPSGCDEVFCRNGAKDIASAIENTLNNNGTWDLASRWPFGHDNTWPYWPIPTLAWNERYRGYFCYRWAQAFHAAVSSIGSPSFSSDIESAIDTKTGRFHFWIRIKSKSSGNEVYVDDSFWDGYFGHTSHPCGGDYPYSGPTTPDPTLPGPFPTPYAPNNTPLPWKW